MQDEVRRKPGPRPGTKRTVNVKESVAETIQKVADEAKGRAQLFMVLIKNTSNPGYGVRGIYFSREDAVAYRDSMDNTDRSRARTVKVTIDGEI